MSVGCADSLLVSNFTIINSVRILAASGFYGYHDIRLCIEAQLGELSKIDGAAAATLDEGLN